MKSMCMKTFMNMNDLNIGVVFPILIKVHRVKTRKLLILIYQVAVLMSE